MEKRNTMPARVFWKPVGLVVLVVSAVMWLAVGLESGDRIKTRDAINNQLRFQKLLFWHIAETNDEKAVDPMIASIAAYLREHREQLDDILERERLISSSFDRQQRTALHVQSPERFPKALLLMTNEPRWRALRDDAVALDTLKKLLSGEMSAVPDAEFDSRSVMPIGLLIAWPLVCQLLSFLIYLLCWGGEETQVYRWYEFRWPVRLSMAVLLPGAAPVLVPMALVALGGHMRKQWHDGGSGVNRRGPKTPRVHKDADGTDFLKKLQKRVERRTEAGNGRALRK